MNEPRDMPAVGIDVLPHAADIGVPEAMTEGAAGYDLRAMLRGGAPDAEISDTVAGIWHIRADRYSELRTAETAKLRKIEMSYIGG